MHQSFGTKPESRITLKYLVMQWIRESGLFFKYSFINLSIPLDLLFLRDLICFLTSTIVNGEFISSFIHSSNLFASNSWLFTSLYTVFSFSKCVLNSARGILDDDEGFLFIKAQKSLGLFFWSCLSFVCKEF